MKRRFKLTIDGETVTEIECEPAPPGFDPDKSFWEWANKITTDEGEPMADDNTIPTERNGHPWPPDFAAAERFSDVVRPMIDADGVPWCRAPEGAETHPCPSHRLQRCAAGGRPWGICSPQVRMMARTLTAAGISGFLSTDDEPQSKPLPCGHKPDTFRRHMAICSKCEPENGHEGT